MSFLRTGLFPFATPMLAALLASCAASRESDNITDAFKEHPPRSIRVFTVFNETTDESATGIVERLVRRELENHGYEVVNDADARMHVVIEEWSSSLEPWHGRSDRTVTLEARLYDASTEALLWSERRTASEDEDEDDEGGWFESVVDYTVDATTELAFDGWGSVGDEAVGKLLKSLPRAPR